MDPIEYGWVVGADADGASSPSSHVYAICTDPLDGYEVGTGSPLAYSDTGYGGWSVPAGKAVLGGGWQGTDSVRTSAPGTPGSVWPHYTFGADEYGWVLSDAPNSAGQTMKVHYIAGTLPPPPPVVCPTPPDLDYSLGYYTSNSLGKTEFVQFTYTNPGPNTITDLAGEFDVEAPWTRNALGTRTGGFIKGLRWQTTVSGTPSGFTAPGAPLTVNDSTATPATTWYDDAIMDSLGNLSIRDVPFSISGLALAPGDSITLRWDGSNGGSNHKNILAAIDNFVLNDTTGGGSSLLYSQDFDAAGQAALAAVGPGGPPDTLGFAPPAGWEVWANTANVPLLHVSDGTSTVWGGVYTGYYATAAASLPPCIEPATDTPLFCTDETTTVQIDLNSVTDLYGYQFEVSYDDTLASASGAFVDSFFDTSPPALRPWDATCAAGTCQFSVSKVDPQVAVTGSGPVAELTFTGLSAGIFDVTINNVILSDIDANPVPGVVVGGPLELTVCGFAKVQGTVSLQGRAAPPAGTAPPTAGLVELADAGFGPYSGAFDATGAYSIDNIKVMPDGTDYTIDATHPLYLDNQIIQTLNPGDDITLNTRLWGGDANNDGTIDVADLGCIGGAFGGAPTVCGTTGSSDITADGAVNILDLVLPGGNYDKSTPQAW